MPEIIAVITEYNPFHCGHKYQLDKIREDNPEAVIFAVMSGNIVQRGEFAFLDKYSRAEMAINSGVDGVFEIPYPYSGSTAELFAYAGVKIAYELGAKTLYFGTESDDINGLECIAKIIDSNEFDELYKTLGSKNLSYLVKREIVLSKMGYSMPKASNDILAIEYIRQILKNNYDIKFRSIKRVGASYKDDSIGTIMSASGIRKAFYEKKEIFSIPNSAKVVFARENDAGRINNYVKTQDFLYHHALMSDPKEIEKSFDCPVGGGFFILDKAKKSKNSEEFFNSLVSKSFTKSRLKRVLLYSLLKVKSISKETNLFTTLLAINENGREAIKQIKKKMPIITKHSESLALSARLKKLYDINKKADEIYEILLFNPNAPENAYKKRPIIK